MICAITFRYAIPLTQQPRDALPRPLFGFSIAGRALVRRIALGNSGLPLKGQISGRSLNN